jgi:hypothetical protein
MRLRRFSLFLMLAGAAIASGCSSLRVKPWQRDLGFQARLTS